MHATLYGSDGWPAGPRTGQMGRARRARGVSYGQPAAKCPGQCSRWTARMPCHRSSKLVMRVRFPLPAPTCNPQVRRQPHGRGRPYRSMLMARRAIGVPLSLSASRPGRSLHAACITYRDTLLACRQPLACAWTPGPPGALAQLEATGLSRLKLSAGRSLTALPGCRACRLAAEVAALEADEDDRRETLEVAAVMEIMRASG